MPANPCVDVCPHLLYFKSSIALDQGTTQTQRKRREIIQYCNELNQNGNKMHNKRWYKLRRKSQGNERRNHHKTKYRNSSERIPTGPENGIIWSRTERATNCTTNGVRKLQQGSKMQHENTKQKVCLNAQQKSRRSGKMRAREMVREAQSKLGEASSYVVFGFSDFC